MTTRTRRTHFAVSSRPTLTVAHEHTKLPASPGSQVIIMSNACDVCGYRNSEVKPGGGFSERGTQITVQVPKPETCTVALQKGKHRIGRRTAETPLLS